MPVSSWSTTAASNTGILTGITLDGASMNVPLTDDAFREMAAQIAAQLGKVGFKGADIASAATTDLSAATGWYVDVTGTTTITSFGTVAAGQMFILRFASSLTLTHNASTLILPQNASVVTQGGDVGIFVSLGGGAWRCINYAAAGGSLPVGTVVDYGGTVAPTGWLLCYGQAVSRATYASLFATISTAYGVGDGSTTFNLPDLRGRVTAGQDDMGGTSANRLTGLSGGVDGDVLGSSGGLETHTLTVAQIPSHGHTGTTGLEGAHTHVFTGTTSGISANHFHSYTYPTGFVSVEEGSGAHTMWQGSTTASTGNQSADHLHSITGTTAAGSSHAHAVTAEGGGAAHNNIQPTTIMNKIIKH